MLSFQQAVIRVRNYYEGDSEIDIIMRLVDLLREDIEEMKADLDVVRDSLTTVVNFIERIDQRMLFD
jgi:archaellum component FlaC